MARVKISLIEMPSIDDEGYLINQSTEFTTLSTGEGNGVQFNFDIKSVIFLKNDTGGNASFSIVLRDNPEITAIGAFIQSPTVVVPDGSTVIYKPRTEYKQVNGLMYIDCDVAGKVLVLKTV